ncbi:hypothetical protein GJU39_23150 [Pedobacter petrophilus]|uniref:Uncharacterized protein n=1 Tax=Pedobacter petrophilus TaxID=1908241 RepID=A0A7K0G6H1_9SPHI|nr:hypothetical protein [Pedobacter petrophilus]MRX78964.1 hypothetical protein [Pedobacter petrophilus]
MKHEISIKYNDQTGEVKLIINGSITEMANSLADLDAEGKLFLANMATIVEVAKITNGVSCNKKAFLSPILPVSM